MNLTLPSCTYDALDGQIFYLEIPLFLLVLTSVTAVQTSLYKTGSGQTS
jgi:hypothetical protein